MTYVPGALVDANGAPLIGAKVSASSIPVVIASDQANLGVILSGDPLGPTSDAIVAAGAAGSVNAKLRRATQGLEDLKTLIALASVTPGVAAANLGKAEDAVHASGDTGVFVLGTRQDTPVATAGTAGDYQAAAYGPTGREYVDAAPAGDVVMWNGVACPVKRVAIAASASGNNTVLAAVTSKYIVVLGYQLVANGTVNAKFQSGAGGTDVTGLAYLIANSGVNSGWIPGGAFSTLAVTTLLNLNLSAAIAVGGWACYIETLSI